jgi:hypothetical protein
MDDKDLAGAASINGSVQETALLSNMKRTKLRPQDEPPGAVSFCC